MACDPNFTGASLIAQLVKNLPATQETLVQFLGWEDPLEKDRLPTLVFWPGEFHGQRSLAAYSPWGHKRESEVAQSCPTLCDPMDSSLHQAPPSMGFSRQEYWSGLPFPSPGYHPNPRIEPGSLALWADSRVPLSIPIWKVHFLSLRYQHICYLLQLTQTTLNYYLNYYLIISIIVLVMCVCAQLCPTLCDPFGILQARILKWEAFPFFRRSSQPRDQTQVSHTAGRFFAS